MNQQFTIGNLKLIEDAEGFGIAQRNKDGFEVIATFKYALDALRYFTEYSITLEAIQVQKTENTNE